MMRHDAEKPKRAAPKKRRRKVAKRHSRKRIGLANLVEIAFDKPMTVTLNGRSKRMSVFSAIHQQLWAREMAGDVRALDVRLLYEAFARHQQPRRAAELIVIGGLPEPAPDRRNAGDE